jgi:predicted alpha/beta hydrolase
MRKTTERHSSREYAMDAEPVAIGCSDGVVLSGHFWAAKAPAGIVVIAPATGVLARYYHRFAGFLAANGLSSLTFDYRGIGASRHGSLRGRRIGWRQWGELDCEAALSFAIDREPAVACMAVGHSIGGVLIGAAPSAARLTRILTVSAQYAYWRDYATAHRSAMLLKWNLMMPALTGLLGYFPGRRLGWLEDLPAGVVFDWAFRRARLELNYHALRRDEVLRFYAGVKAAMLAIHVDDDEFTAIQGIRRTLSYYTGCDRELVVLEPGYGGQARIGHFGLFHERFRLTFWQSSFEWLAEGTRIWPSPHVRPLPLLAN